MFGLFIHRRDGVTIMEGPYSTAAEAYMARAEYLQAARRNGFVERRGRVATFLKAKGVNLEVWVERCEELA